MRRSQQLGLPTARGARWSTAVALVCLIGGACKSAASYAAAPAAPLDYPRQIVASLPLYQPRQQVSGTIRLWGHGSPKHDFLGKLLRRWETDFHRYQPGVRVVDEMYGSASGVGALYTGAGNLAILGEEISPAAERAFERERHYAPTSFEVATGSVETNYFDYAHMVFVNRANPLDRLTLAQLAAIFGKASGEGGAGDTRTWGQLGLPGVWASHSIQPYFWKTGEDFALFFRARVLAGRDAWNPAIRQFVTFNRPDGTVDDRGEQILEALARDPYGIAVSNIRFANPGVKVVKLAATPAGPYLLATPRTLISQSYPLTRIIPAVVDRAPGQPLDPAVREFLRFILSREGQQALIEESQYLPLGVRQIRTDLRAIDGMSHCRPNNICPAPSGRPPGAAESGPGRPIPDTIRVWGHADLRGLAQRWAAGLRATHQQVKIELHMTGSDTGMAGLYTGEADVALLRRAATDSEMQAFAWVFRHPPERVEILRGRHPVYAYINFGPGTQSQALTFIRYILSHQGQAAAQSHGGYLPIPEALARAQSAQLAGLQ